MDEQPAAPDTARVSHPEDLALVRAALSGDRRAREVFADRLGCVGRIVAFRNRGRGGPLDDDELRDVTHDVVVRVLEKLREYGGFAALETWIWMFCDGEVRNAERKKWRAARRGHEQVDGLAATDNSGRAVGDDVGRCLEGLDSADQQLIHWKHFENMTLEEIGRRSAAKLNTVKSRYWRALQQLRSCLERRRRS